MFSVLRPPRLDVIAALICCFAALTWCRPSIHREIGSGKQAGTVGNGTGETNASGSSSSSDKYKSRPFIHSLTTASSLPSLPCPHTYYYSHR